MSFKKQDIITKLGIYKCPQGECQEVAKKITEKLLGGEFKIEKAFCSSLDESLAKIDNFLTEENLVIIWPSSGFRDPQCTIPTYHFYIIFSTNPLQSFSVWDHGIEFYDEKYTKDIIEKTIESDKHGKRIEIQQCNKKL